MNDDDTASACEQGSEKVGTALARHTVPFLIVFLLLMFLGENILFAYRNKVITECARALLVDRVDTVSSLMSELSVLHPRKMPLRKSERNEGRQEFNLVFPAPSALHLWVEFQPETDRITDYGLVYFASEKVNLITHEGAATQAPPSFVFVLTLATAIAVLLWYVSFSLRLWPGRLLQAVAIAVTATVGAVVFSGVVHFIFVFGLG